MDRNDYIAKIYEKNVIKNEELANVYADIVMNLTEIRRSQNVTQVEIAKRMGVNQTNVSRFEVCNGIVELGFITNYLKSLGMELKVDFEEIS